MSRSAKLSAILWLLPYAASSGDAASHLRVKGTVAQMYDDNITFAQTNRQKDFILNLSGGLGARLETPRTDTELIGNLNHQIFYDHSDFNNTSEDATLRFLATPTEKDRLSLSDAFSHTYEPRSLQQELGRTQGRYSTIDNKWSLDYERALNSQAAVTATAGQELDLFGRDDIRDSMMHRTGAGLVVRPVPELALSAEYGLAARKFEGGADAVMHSALGGIRRDLTSRLYVEAKGGANFIRSYGGKNEANPIAFATLSGELSETTNARLTFEKKYYLYAYTQDLFNYWQLSGTLNRQLSERWETALYGFYGSGEYVAAVITDRLLGGGVKLEYDITERFKAQWSYQRSDLYSTIPFREYAKNNFYFGISADF